MTEEGFFRLNEQFLSEGYVVLPLEHQGPLDDARDALVRSLRRLTGVSSADFANYHEICRDERTHEKVLEGMTSELREGNHAGRIVRSLLPFFRRFIGPDLCLQRLPYLRIARPGAEGDNVHYHRDTQYGRSPFEISVWIPFVDISPEMALRILPGSHVAPETDYPTTQNRRPDVKRGGLKHRLGFPYAPKRMGPEIEPRMQAVPVKYGEVLLFSLSVVHGQRVNEGTTARFTCDTRVVNGLAPIAWSATVSGRYYETLSRSAVSEQARRYAVSNQVDTDLDELIPEPR